jgi:hypothetical protein
MEHENKVVRLDLFFSIEQELPNGRRRQIEANWWGKEYILSFTLEIDCGVVDGKQYCDRLITNVARGNGIQPNFGRVSAGYFSVIGYYAVQPIGQNEVVLRPVRPEDIPKK